MAVLALGLFLGVRHATDSDHVVAVSTIVSRERTTRAALRIGALWGLGHTFSILMMGGTIVVFGLVIPPRLGLSMEMSVAAMLVVLGVMNVSGAKRNLHVAAHGEPAPAGEAGEAADPAEHAGSLRSEPRIATRSLLARLRPLVVGVIHGLAGSAAIALLVLSTIRSVGQALLYLAVFGAGTVLGMLLLTAVVALPMAAAARRFASFEPLLARATGVVSIAFGIFLGYQIGFVEGLFSANMTWSPK